MHPFFNVGNLAIPAYWLLGMAGIFAVFIYIIVKKKKFTIENDDIFHMALFGLVGAIIASKILFFITLIPGIIRNFQFTLENPSVLLGLLKIGSVFFGGLIGAIVGIFYYAKKYNINKLEVMALIGPAFPLFHGFGRIGCYLAGCCGGNLFIPIQLFEAGFNFIIFGVLLVIQKKVTKKWITFPIYIIIYSIFRFIIEFFRTDDIRGVFILSTSQYVSIIVIGITLFLLIKGKKKHVY